MDNIMEAAAAALAELEALPITEVILLAKLVREMRAETREGRLRTMVLAAERRGAYLERQAARMRERRHGQSEQGPGASG